MRLILTSWVHLPRWLWWCTAPARLGSDLHILFEAAITQLLSDIHLKCKHENSRVLLAHERMKEVSATQAGPNPQICMYLVGYESRGKICKWFFLDPSSYEASAVEFPWWRCWTMLPDVMCVMKTLLHVTMDWNTQSQATEHPTIEMDPRMNCKFKTQIQTPKC